MLSSVTVSTIRSNVAARRARVTGSLVADRFPHVISFRIDNTEGMRLAALRAASPDNTWGGAMRLLLADPDVQVVIERLITGSDG